MLQVKVKLGRGGVKVPPPLSGKGLASVSASESGGVLADQQVKDLPFFVWLRLAVGSLDLGAGGRAALAS